MNEGKLIMLTTNSIVNPAGATEWPLTRLPFYFPIPPGEWSNPFTAEHAEQNVVRRGTISQFGGPSLETWGWDGELLDEDWMEAGALPPYVITPPAGMVMHGAHSAKEILRGIAKAGHVVNLSIIDQQTGRLEVFSPATLRTFDLRETGGEPDTRFYTINFSEYRFLRIRHVPRGGVPPSGGIPRPPIIRYVPNPWTLPRQLGIKRVSLYAYHTTSHWKEIYKANGGEAGLRRKGATYNPKAAYGPWIIPKGVRLYIPGKQQQGQAR